ncbi:MAG: peptidoglycan DD-metalloendopeptidase family protein [Sulfurovum sp.]
MRYFILLLVSISLMYGSHTSTKIKKSKENLSVTTNAKKMTNKKLNKIAKDIKSTEKELSFIEKKIYKLGIIQEKAQKEHKELKSQLSQSKQDYVVTNKSLEAKRKAFVSLLSEQFSTVFAMNRAHEPTKKSIITQEVYKAYKKYNAKLLATLKSDMVGLKKQKKDITKMYNNLKKEIANILKEKREYEKKKLVKEKLRKRLFIDEENYNIQLGKIEEKQNLLRSTLAHLNILQKNEVEKSRKLARARKKAMRIEKKYKRALRKKQARALSRSIKAKERYRRAKTAKARKKAKDAIRRAQKEQDKLYKNSENIKQVNSSYKKSKTYKYRGRKTISPIRGARLIKKFGTYIDPIYKIKIFNESITLKAPRANAKVKTVLNGKVVFAGKSSMLGKVVVVSHSHKIHTVYAGLSKIAPTIRVGSKIKKGYTIGKVTRKLIFQATKNSKHINPLKLIRI